MSTLGSGGPSPAAAVDTSSHWVPHGTVLTACVVSVNVLAIVLIFFLFWRFLFGKEEPSTSAAAASAAAADEDDSLPVASPWASRWRQQEDLRAPPLEDVASALPVYVYSSAGAGDEADGKQHAGECAVCIVELRDGEPARRVPRCGHQFHADCVGEWLRLHATCPLCRASVVAPAAAGAAVADESRNTKEEDDDVAADCPV
ncbi:unnamed protein product [Urochloa humidicola]